MKIPSLKDEMQMTEMYEKKKEKKQKWRPCHLLWPLHPQYEGTLIVNERWARLNTGIFQKRCVDLRIFVLFFLKKYNRRKFLLN